MRWLKASTVAGTEAVRPRTCKTTYLPYFLKFKERRLHVGGEIHWGLKMLLITSVNLDNTMLDWYLHLLHVVLFLKSCFK